MTYDAKIVSVMIASPSDVSAERQIVRDVIYEWNDIHSRESGAALMPIGWETHSSPELGGRAQQMINDRVLLHADILVGIFWTRVGSPTGLAMSGTIEEIEEHLRKKKPVMLYFANSPIEPNKIDRDQHKQLEGI